MKILKITLLSIVYIFNTLANPLQFAYQAAKKMRTIGTFVELSETTAEELTKELTLKNRKGLKILEIGAGRGNITKKIASNLKKDDIFDVVEIIPEFCATLKDKFSSNKQIRIHCADFLKWKNIEKKYDLVISTVPHTTLGPTFTKKAFKRYKELTKGTLKYVQYAAIYRLKGLRSTESKQKSLRTRKVMEDFYKENKGNHTLVASNIPPVWIYTIKI